MHMQWNLPIIFSFVIIVSTIFATRQLIRYPHRILYPHKPNVPWAPDALFIPQTHLSDEFSGSQLDLTKWDEHALRSPDTGCPHWNGPIYPDHPQDSTLYPTTTDPVSKQKSVHFHEVNSGNLNLHVEEKGLSFFEQREYYCNNATFTCNHNANISCFATDVWGDPLLDQSGRNYVGIVHDKCKVEPFCIPHHQFVTGEKDRPYTRIVSSHIASIATLKYGFIETRVRLADSPAVAAIWLHNDDMTEGWCRYRHDETGQMLSLECPSATRSRRWQEIDILEAMNSGDRSKEYYPNVHAFAMYKGEFSSVHSTPNNSGGMGGGPIIISGVFNEENPSFSDVPSDKRKDNDWHWEPGPVTEMNSSWADEAHTVGLYWSPNELRFYMDGKEVARLKNSLIHQPMHIDISYGLNTPWVTESPTKKQLNESIATVDYIRTWKVLTMEGHEPASELTVREDMVTGFDDIYGNKLYGVFDRFPTNDSHTSVKLRYSARVATNNTKRATDTRNSATGAENKRVHTIADDDAQCQDTWTGDGNQYEKPVGLIQGLLTKRFYAAGGTGNGRFINARRCKMSQVQRNAMLARKDRHARVWRGKRKRVGLIPQGGRTVFDISDPNAMLAGWAMRRNNSHMTWS